MPSNSLGRIFYTNALEKEGAGLHLVGFDPSSTIT